ncbi:transglycosylase domain-containing protein [Krasilnikovia sp. MM14-A1259]|uniref:transglycosylase domain-containing protein n=1 Tax=Krasilnikovia sp. MM14-A1259 TaxID=3373539 RepID=UPI0037F57EC2
MDEPTDQPGRGRHRVRNAKRWRRIAGRLLALVLFWCGTGTAAAEAYVDSVPMPEAAVAPQASVLYYRDGRTVLARVGTVDHSDVPLSAVPLVVRQAVLAAEDRDFYDHVGVSARGVLRAAVADLRGGRQGASTITQQYVRNAYLTQDFSVDRKVREMALAVKLERQLDKDEILTRYLNTIYFGRRAYGIAAAAHAYFGVTPDRLTAAQGAVLAAVIKDPTGYDPAVDRAAAQQRWEWIVEAQRTLGWLGGDVAYPEIAPTESPAAGPVGLVVDRVERELAAHGISGQTLHTRGLSVVTTIDAAAQDAAGTVIRRQLANQPAGLQAALVALDPATGGVRAYYGGDKGRGYFDNAAALHPAASTFKPIVLAAAEHAGIGYESRWDGSSPRLFPGRNGVPLKNHDGLQCGDCTLEQAMVQSLNTPFYAVTERIGADRVRDMAVNLGIPARYDGRPSMVDAKGDPKPGRTRPDIAIGRYPVTPADLASVFATFAAGGVRNDRFFVQTAREPGGRVVWSAAPRGRAVLDARIAADVSTVLQSVVKGDNVVPGRPAAGKTGTQQWANTRDNQDAWMAGYTPDLAAAVWIGKAVPGPIRDSANRPIEGENMPARLWRDFLHDSLRDAPRTTLPRPAHVGRTDVGDAGRSPDSVPGKRPAPTGFEPVVHTAHDGKRLALTFDDGPSAQTPQVLDLLAKYHVRATFCMVGEEVARYPEVVKRIVAEGHALCNHSMHHDDLGTLPPDKVADDIAATDAALAAAVPGATVTYFRAPYGDWGASAKVGAQLGHTPLGWVVDPDDWRLPGADEIASRIEKQLTDRAVMLVHDGGGDRRQTVDALTGLIPKLLGQGWTFDLPETTRPGHRLPAAGAGTGLPGPGPDTRLPQNAASAASPSAAPSTPACGSRCDEQPGDVGGSQQSDDGTSTCGKACGVPAK